MRELGLYNSYISTVVFKLNRSIGYLLKVMNDHGHVRFLFINQYVHLYSAYRQKSSESEVLADKQVSFELFSSVSGKVL